MACAGAPSAPATAGILSQITTASPTYWLQQPTAHPHHQPQLHVAHPAHLTQQPPQFHTTQPRYSIHVPLQLNSELAQTVTQFRVMQPVTAVHQLSVGSTLEQERIAGAVLTRPERRDAHRDLVGGSRVVVALHQKLELGVGDVPPAL